MTLQVNNPLENDLAFYTVVLICFCFFTLEFIFYSLFKVIRILMYEY